MTTIWTFGHSTRSLDDFVAVLQSTSIQVLADVRRFPASRRNPHFAADALKRALFQAGITYLYLGDELGGFRKPRPDSPHVGLRNTTFRGYADWMDGPEFRRGLQRLLERATAQRVCIMCAERPVSNCHRRLIGDYLSLVHGVRVVDLYDPGDAHDHTLTPGVVRSPEGVLYAPPRSSPALDQF
jgi:uncharacterized protein (DUF488 family)